MAVLSLFRMIALGELFDGLEIGAKINDIFGIPNKTKEESSSVGSDQSDAPSIIESLGATLLLVSVSVLALVLLLLVFIWCYKRNNKSLPSCLTKIVNKVFYNVLIRYTLLNCLKLNMLASVALFKTENTYGQIC